MPVDTLESLTGKASLQPVCHLVVAMAADEYVLIAVKEAMELGFVRPILVGDETIIKQLAESISFDLSKTELCHAPDEQASCRMAAQLAAACKRGILMKGMVRTGNFLKPVLGKEFGLMEGKLLSHFALFDSPYYHKPLGVTDAAINIIPNLQGKVAIIENGVKLMHRIGVPRPKVAVLSAIETVNPRIESTVHAALLSAMNRRGQLTGCLVDGPFALDNAISAMAAGHKGLNHEVAGDADMLVAPDLVSGNILYKALNFMGGASSAAVVLGAAIPIVLTSRADNPKSKLASIALAALLSD